MNRKKCCILDIRTWRTLYSYYYFESVEIEYHSGSLIKLDAGSKLYLLRENGPASIRKNPPTTFHVEWFAKFYKADDIASLLDELEGANIPDEFRLWLSRRI